MLSAGLGLPVAPGLIYAGQAGATKWPSGRRSTATLITRIRDNHMRGRISGSTFRLTLASILRNPLRLTTDGQELSGDSNRALTAWMRTHLTVTAAPIPDRHGLAAIEDEVLRALDPPLNLLGMSPSQIRYRLREQRGRLAAPLDPATSRADRRTPRLGPWTGDRTQLPPSTPRGMQFTKAQPFVGDNRESRRPNFLLQSQIIDALGCPLFMLDPAHVRSSFGHHRSRTTRTRSHKLPPSIRR